MAKKFGRNGNHEGSVYNTIQKIDRKEKRLNFVCEICKNCNDWNSCQNRTGTNKCQKCIECTDCLKKGFCDRFYCYERYPAQITLDDHTRTTIANEKTRSKSIEKKKEIEAQIQTKSYVKKNGITIIEISKKLKKEKFESGNIKTTTKNKDKYQYNYIDNWLAFQKPVQQVSYQDINNFLNSIRHLSQGEINRIINKLKASFMECVLEKIISYPDNPMLRITTPVSLQTKKKVQAFEANEQSILMEYIKNQILVKSNKCNYEEQTLRNLFILLFLSAARIGELGAINYETKISWSKGGLLIDTTLTKDENDHVIMGTTTKTGNNKILNGEVDERLVPFNIFDEKLFLDTLNNQIEYAKSNPFNKEKLLFCQKNGKYIDHRSINTIFKRICREARIKLDLPKGCHLHMTRHSAATRMLEAGMDSLMISYILGHVDDRQLKSTYGHILPGFMKEQLKYTRNYFGKNIKIA